MRLLAASTLLLLCSCASRADLVFLEFPQPDAAMRAVLQNIAVADDRPSQEFVISGTSGERSAYRPFPDLDAALTLYLAEALLRDYPEFAARLPGAAVTLSISIRGLSGVRVPDHANPGGSHIRLAYHLVAYAPVGPQKTTDYRWTSEIAAPRSRELDELGAEIDKSLRDRARKIVDAFVRDTLPLMPPPDDPAFSEPVTS